MTELVNGLALYDLEDLTIKEASFLAEEFFRNIDIEPNSTYYFYSHAPDKNGETVSAMDVSLNELKTKINQSSISNFRMNYCSTERLWDIGFAFFTKDSEFGEGISCIEITFLNNLLKLDAQKIKDFLWHISTKAKISYGIGYQLYGSIDKPFNYVLGLDSSQIYDFENPSEWLYQLPSRTDEKPQYNHKLRMVYEINLLNSNHLELKLGKNLLREWILSDNKNGRLQELSRQNFLWSVENTELERINNVLGEAGLLISWFSAKKLQKKRFL